MLQARTRVAALVAVLSCSALAQPTTPGSGGPVPHPLPAPRAIVDHLADLWRGGPIPATPGVVRSLHWTLDVRNRQTGVTQPVSSEDAAYRVRVVPLGSGWIIEWNDVRSPALPSGEGLDVRAIILPAPDPALAEVRLSAELSGVAARDASIHGAWFPVTDVGAAPTDDLTLPVGSGAILDDVLSHPLGICPGDEYRIRHPGSASMQWFCLWPGDGSIAFPHPSFFLSTRDVAGVAKEYCTEARPNEGAVRFSVRHVPADSLNATLYDAPFSTALGTTNDDWTSAAFRYRAWAEQQPFASPGPVASNSDFAAPIKQMRMFGVFAPDVDFELWWPWRDRHFEQALRFQTPAIVPQNYGWYDHGFDQQYGDWTVSDDWATHAARMAASGVAFSPYTILHVLSEGSEPVVPGYDPGSGPEFAVVDETGAPATFTDAGGRTAYELCQSTAFARDYAVQVAKQLHSYGAGGMYIDLMNALPAQLCYSDRHGHVPADPENTTRRLELLDAIRAAVDDKAFFLSSESLSELYLGHFELGMSQWTKNFFGTAVEFAPLFETVYHRYLRIGKLGAVLNLANENLPPVLLQVLSRQTYAAHVFMGRVPFAGSLLNDDTLLDNMQASPAWALFIEFVDQTMSFLETTPLVQHVGLGERLRDPVVDVAQIDLEKAEEFLLLLTLPYGVVQPSVYVSAWGSPQAGTIALFLQNWTDGFDPTFASTIPNGSFVTFDPKSLGFDPKWFAEYNAPPISVAAEEIKAIIFSGGGQPYTIDFDPAQSGYGTKKWNILHYTGNGPPTIVGQQQGAIHLTGTIPARTTEAYLLVPAP